MRTGNHDASQPLVTILVPCLNEELVVGEFVNWCWQGLAAAKVTGEVLIVDSSTDRSPEIAEALGARVLRVPKRGLGQAYIDAIPHVRGRYVIMGDADLTYDFRDITMFVEKLEAGFEFVMGTRLRGSVDPGAMPALHRYFGTPVTTFILNWMYGTRHSDIHCGMRGMTLDALRRINLESTSWEYASEMVLKAALLKLRTTDVPITFHRDREGRTSHHVRSGWTSPWKAGWINLRAMFVYAPDFFLFKPGVGMLVAGLLLLAALANGPLTLAHVSFNLHWMLLGLTSATVGYSAVQLAVLSRVYRGFDPGVRARALRLFGYDRGVPLGLSAIAVGVGLNLVMVSRWFAMGLRLDEIGYGSVFGLALIILGFQTMTFTLILHMIVHTRRHASGS